jgi:acetoin utilization protein AcuB
MKSIPISSIMTKNVVCVSPDQKIIDVKHIYEKKNFHHHIPVTEDGELKGMISLIDFMYNIAGAGMSDNSQVYNELKVKDIMTPRPFYLTTNSTVEDAAKQLEKGYFHAVPVLENNKIVGIVSTADIIKYFLNSNL